MKTYVIKTFGCSMNYSDTERVATVLDANGLKEILDENEADFVVFTTCSVKQKAEDKVYSLINNIHKNRQKKNLNTKIVLTGCMVKKTSTQQFIPEEKDPILIKIPKIDIVFRIEDIYKIPELLEIGESKILDSYLNVTPKYSSSFQAIVPIQIGCDNYCTFCIVPYTRGREWSRPMKQILSEIEELAKKGVKEINLVGQNVNSYGKDLMDKKRKWDDKEMKWIKGEEKTPFTILLEEINKIEGIERVRFQSSNPHDMTDDIIEAICTLPKVMPNLHFALQSGDNNVLRRMNRKHSYEEYRNIVQKIRSINPKFSITTDIIVGFCGETDEEFEHTMEGIKELDIDLIYISQYSPRKGTVSGDKMKDDVPQEVKKSRWHKINNWLKIHVKNKMKNLVGSTQKVLIGREENGFFEGKNEYNVMVQVEGKNIKVGDIVDVEITDYSTWAVKGKKL